MPARGPFLRLLLLCWTVAVVGCNRQQPTSALDPEIESVEQQTMSPTSTLQGSPQRTIHGASIEVRWQIRTSSNTSDYFDWVQQRLASRYHVASRSPSALTLTRADSGDAYAIEMTPHSDSDGLKIDVRFSAMPD